jgi:hypothetical protein
VGGLEAWPGASWRENAASSGAAGATQAPL